MKKSHITMTKSWFFFFFFNSQPTSVANVYLSLNLPKLRLFSAVHLTVDDQDIRKASDVASLHLKRCKMHDFNARDKGTSCCCCCPSAVRRWDSLLADTSRSFHTTPGCSAPDRCSSSRSRQSRTPSLCLMNQRTSRISSFRASGDTTDAEAGLLP